MSACQRQTQAALFGTEADRGRGRGPVRGGGLQPAGRPGLHVPGPGAAGGRRCSPGQRVRVPLGRGNKPAVGYCVRVDATPPDGRRAGAGQGRARRARRPAADRRGDARADALDGRLLRLLVGPGARRRGAGRGEEGGGDAGRDLPDRPRRGPPGAARPSTLPPKQAEVLAILCRSDEPLTVADVCRLARCATGPIAALRQRGYVHTVKRRIDRPPPATRRPTRGRGDAGGRRLGPDRRAGDGAGRAGPGAGRRRASPPSCCTASPAAARPRSTCSAIEEVVAPGQGGDRPGARDQPDAADDRAVPRPVRRGRGAAQPPHRRRAAPALAAHRRGQVQVVVGARSAVFAPTRKLGLIVIDEEHESTFKQETDAALPRPRRGRDARPAGEHPDPAGLGDARRWRAGTTPSTGSYTLLTLPQPRRGPAAAAGRT